MTVRIAFLGVGGVGGWLAARLVESAGKAGEAPKVQVLLIARGAHGAAIREKGLRLHVRSRPEPHDVFLPPGGAEVYSSVAEAVAQAVQPVDFVVLGVKSWQVQQAAAEALPLLGTSGCVVTTQNGIEAHQKAAEAIGFDRVVCGVAKVIVFIASPGEIEMEAQPAIFQFGEVFEADGTMTSCSSSDRTERLAAAFAGCVGMTARVSLSSAWAMLWEKAVIMCSMGPLGALTRAPIDKMLSTPETRELLRSAMREVAACAAAGGHLLEGQTPQGVADDMIALVEQSQKGASGATTSTTRDICCGRPSELDQLTGAIVRAGCSLGVPTPTHDMILAALLPQERRARGTHPYELKGVPGGAPHVQQAVPESASK